MKNKVLIVPDVHGRSFWKEPCYNWPDQIIFLGDYHDPYPWQVLEKESLENLKELVEFYKNNSERIICLMGNHDANYIIYKNFADRLDTIQYDSIKALLSELNLKIIHQIEDVLFSHSGVLKKWLEVNNLTLDSLKSIDLNNKALADISPMRGGLSEVGGVLWGDVIEYNYKEHIPNIYQVFGHTQSDHEIITKDFACLDCRRCFTMDTETKEIQIC